MSRAWLALVLTASLALHAGAFAAFQREAPPLASVGVESISIEIVLGTDTAGGLAKTPVEAESAIDSVAAEGQAPELVKPETARAEVKLAEAAPQAEAEAPSEVAAAVVRLPNRLAVVQRRTSDKGDDARTRDSRAAFASIASSGIGRGRSDALSNYRGLVAAQLARNKQFPPEARRNGQEGRAVVAFTIKPGGRVTRVALVRGTGIDSLDREVQALVYRAAPFPPPPSQQQMRFTVPISFNIR